MEDSSTVLLFSLFGLFSALGGIYFLLRCCWVQGAQCLTRNRIDDRTVLITEADSGVGIELVRELARRGARVIMAVKDIEMATDVAVEVRGETNGEVIIYIPTDKLRASTASIDKLDVVRNCPSTDFEAQTL